MDDKEIVSAVQAALVDRVGQDRFDLWLGATRMRVRGDLLIIAVARQFAQNWLRRNLRREIEAAAAAACARPMSLEFRIDASLGAAKAANSAAGESSRAAAGSPPTA